MNQNLMPMVLRYVQLSSATAKQALDQLGARRQAEKRAQAEMPATIAALLASGTITEAQKTAAAEMLADHGKTMQLLKNAVAKIAELSATKKQAAALGTGVDDTDKTAGDGGENDFNKSLTSPFVGQRTSEKKASDHKLFAGLGIAV
jgi:hypothetical protein